MTKLKEFSVMSPIHGTIESTGYLYLDSSKKLIYEHYGSNYQLYIASVF